MKFVEDIATYQIHLEGLPGFKSLADGNKSRKTKTWVPSPTDEFFKFQESYVKTGTFHFIRFWKLPENSYLPFQKIPEI